MGHFSTNFPPSDPYRRSTQEEGTEKERLSIRFAYQVIRKNMGVRDELGLNQPNPVRAELGNQPKHLCSLFFRKPSGDVHRFG